MSSGTEVVESRVPGGLPVTSSSPSSHLQTAFMTVVRQRFNAAAAAAAVAMSDQHPTSGTNRVPVADLSPPTTRQISTSNSPPSSDRKQQQSNTGSGVLAFSVAAIMGRRDSPGPSPYRPSPPPVCTTEPAVGTPPPTVNGHRVRRRRRRQQRRRASSDADDDRRPVMMSDDEIEPEVDVEREDDEDDDDVDEYGGGGGRDDDGISVDSYCGGDDSDFEDRLRGADTSLDRESPSSSSPQSTSSGRPLVPPGVPHHHQMLFRGPPPNSGHPPFLPASLQDLSTACKTWPQHLAAAAAAAHQFQQQNPWFGTQFTHPPSKFHYWSSFLADFLACACLCRKLNGHLCYVHFSSSVKYLRDDLNALCEKSE